MEHAPEIVTALIDSLSGRFGDQFHGGWASLVSYTRMMGWCLLSGCLASFVGPLLAWRARSRIKTTQYGCEADGATVVLAILSIVAVFSAIILVSDVIPRIIAPETYLLKSLLP